MNQWTNSLSAAARVIAALGLLSGTTALASTPTTIAVGHYYTTEVVISLTGTGGVTDAECAEYYQAAGSQIVAITNATIYNGKSLTFDVRFPLPETQSNPDLGVFHQALVQSKGSTLLNETGTITSYSDGTQAAPSFPYTAALTIYDQESFGGTITADAPSPTGKGSCSQVISTTFVQMDPT